MWNVWRTYVEVWWMNLQGLRDHLPETVYIPTGVLAVLGIQSAPRAPLGISWSMDFARLVIGGLAWAFISLVTVWTRNKQKAAAEELARPILQAVTDDRGEGLATLIAGVQLSVNRNIDSMGEDFKNHRRSTDQILARVDTRLGAVETTVKDVVERVVKLETRAENGA